jgi:rod shape-determining protein MreD
MRPVSYQILTVVPALVALVLVLMAAVPFGGAGLGYTPNVAWLMTLIMAAFFPPAWPRGWAFFLGLLQDMLVGTPLGSQALLALLLAQCVGLSARHQQVQLFRLRWLEAAGMMVLWHLLLWAIMQAVQDSAPSLHHMLRAGLISALWYPVFYGAATRVFGALPDAK